MNRKARVTEHSQRHSRGILWRCSVTFDVKHGKVPRADKLHRTIMGRPSHNESRELSGESALAENAVGVCHHAIEFQTGFGEAAKRIENAVATALRSGECTRDVGGSLDTAQAGDAVVKYLGD